MPDDPAPPVTDTLPATCVFAVVSPAVTLISPPLVEVPEPTLKTIRPPLPLVAEPVSMATRPLVPELVVPVKNFKWPLTPSVPASAVFITIEPLVVAVPLFADNETKPPV